MVDDAATDTSPKYPNSGRPASSSISSSGGGGGGRRSGRNHSRTTLSESFKEYIEGASSSELHDFSCQLQNVLGALSIDRSNNIAVSNSSSLPIIAAASTATAPRRSPSKGALNERSDFNDATAHPHCSTNSAATHMNRRLSGEYFYNPLSTSRRNSAKGEELAISMKVNAATMLAELGSISDDDDDNYEGEGNFCLCYSQWSCSIFFNSLTIFRFRKFLLFFFKVGWSI